MGRRTDNGKRVLYESTAEAGLIKSKYLPNTVVLKVEVVVRVFHLMERKQDIAIVGGAQYLARQNEEKKRNMTKKKWRESNKDIGNGGGITYSMIGSHHLHQVNGWQRIAEVRGAGGLC